MKIHKIRIFKAAVKITEKALSNILPHIKPGVKEKTISSLLKKEILRLGADSFAFRTIVASGHRSVLPHGFASKKIIGKNDIVMIDFGVKYMGILSDISRTYVLGRITKKHKEVFNALRKAQKAAIKKIRSGVKACEVDRAARDVLKKHKLDKYFIHTTGHGVGKKIHEAPKISSSNTNVLKSGMVLTVEPGVYIKGWGGMRIEDMVLVTERGSKILTTFPRRLRIK